MYVNSIFKKIKNHNNFFFYYFGSKCIEEISMYILLDGKCK